MARTRSATLDRLVPSAYRANADDWISGYRHDRLAVPPYPGPARTAYQAGWVAASRARVRTLELTGYGTTFESALADARSRAPRVARHGDEVVFGEIVRHDCYMVAGRETWRVDVETTFRQPSGSAPSIPFPEPVR